MSAAVCAVAEVPCDIAATRLTNPPATINEAIMLLTNFIFITVVSFHCFGLPWLPIVGGHFRPLTGVMRKVPARGYAESFGFLQKVTKETKNLCGTGRFFREANTGGEGRDYPMKPKFKVRFS